MNQVRIDLPSFSTRAPRGAVWAAAAVVAAVSVWRWIRRTPDRMR